MWGRSPHGCPLPGSRWSGGRTLHPPCKTGIVPHPHPQGHRAQQRRGATKPAPRRDTSRPEEAVSQGALTETPPQTVQGSWSWGEGNPFPRSGLWALTCVESPKAQRQRGAAPDLGSARRPRGKRAKVAAASAAQDPASRTRPLPPRIPRPHPPRAGPGRLSRGHAPHTRALPRPGSHVTRALL